MKSVTIPPIVREKPVAKTAIIMLKSAQSIAKAIAAKAHIRLNHIGLVMMITRSFERELPFCGTLLSVSRACEGSAAAYL